MVRTILAYTDGSAVASGRLKGHGGFGTYFPDLNGEAKAFSLGYLDTKTGRMEITALLFAIKNIPLDLECELVVYSDSQYVTKTFTENRLSRWILNNWISNGVQVKNVDLWSCIQSELYKRPKMILTMKWIKAHQLDKLKKKDILKRKELLENEHIFGNAVADLLADHKRHIIKLKSDRR